MDDGIIFKSGLTENEARAIAGAAAFMEGPGADLRIGFIQKLRNLHDSKMLSSPIGLDRSTASCFASGISLACQAQGRSDAQVEALLQVAAVLKIRSWIIFQKVEPFKNQFDIPFDKTEGDHE